MSPAHNLTIAFCGLAVVTAAAAVEVGAKGHAETLPGYGAVEDKTCPGGRRPGDWWTFFPQYAAKDIVLAMGNDCKHRAVRLDPVTRQPVELVSLESEGQPRPVPGSRPAPEAWWEKADVLPATRQGPPTLIDAGGYFNNNLCRVKLAGGQEISVPVATVIIPDLRSAYAVSVRRDSSITQEERSGGQRITYSNGKPFCVLEPLVLMPDSASPASITASITVSGGGIRNPGHIGGGTLPAQPAGLAVPLAAAAPQAAAMVSAFGFLAMNWLQNHKGLMAGGAIVYSYATDVLLAAKEISGLSAQELGQLNAVAAGTHAPTQGEVDEALKEASQPATAEAARLSQEHAHSKRSGGGGTGGNCTPDYLRELEDRKEAICNTIENPQRIPRPLVCNSTKSVFQNLVFARLHAACARQRDQIRKECFDGGNDGHREQSEVAWSAANKCLRELLR